MKRFLINLIATILLLIVTLSSFGFSKDCSIIRSQEELDEIYLNRVKELNITLSEIEKQEDGYKLVKTFVELPQKIFEYSEIHYGDKTYTYSAKNKEGLNVDGCYIVIDMLSEENVEIVEKEMFFIDKDYINLQIKEVTNSRYTFAPIALLNFDNKIFVYSKGYQTGTTLNNNVWYFPPVLFTLDLETGEMKYAGFMELDNLDDFYHQKYMIVKE